MFQTLLHQYISPLIFTIFPLWLSTFPFLTKIFALRCTSCRSFYCLGIFLFLTVLCTSSLFFSFSFSFLISFLAPITMTRILPLIHLSLACIVLLIIFAQPPVLILLPCTSQPPSPYKPHPLPSWVLHFLAGATPLTRGLSTSVLLWPQPHVLPPIAPSTPFLFPSTANPAHRLMCIPLSLALLLSMADINVFLSFTFR